MQSQLQWAFCDSHCVSAESLHLFHSQFCSCCAGWACQCNSGFCSHSREVLGSVGVQVWPGHPRCKKLGSGGPQRAKGWGSGTFQCHCGTPGCSETWDPQLRSWGLGTMRVSLHQQIWSSLDPEPSFCQDHLIGKRNIWISLSKESCI